MSETLSQPRPLAEVLNPRVTPEMGFQSYEMLAGDGEYRDAQKNLFLGGEIINPDLDYPRLDPIELSRKIGTLQDILTLADGQTDPEVRAAVWDSAGYRMAEMYWLLSCDDLVRTHKSVRDEVLDTKVKNTQELNEQLYGCPEAELVMPLVAEIWAQIDEKPLSEAALQIKRELENGFLVHIAGQTIDVQPLPRVESERLPKRPQEMLDRIREKIYEDNQDIVDLVQGYWELKIMHRPEGERAFQPEDMFEIFTAVHKLRDPENKSGVTVIMDPSATALSWETPFMAVKIGGKRDPITEPETMLAKVIHEYVVHGGRAVRGSRTKLPVLGTGLFTEADPGEMSDYLTFEEGFASTCEAAVSKEPDSWKPVDTEKSLAIALAYDGRSFRQIYETLWRARILMLAKDGADPTEKALNAAKRNAYEAMVRVFRGTPTDMPRVNQDGDPRILTYNKDLAYLKGKQQVIEFWNRYKDDEEMLDLVFGAKFDPLNKRQLALVRSAHASGE